MKDVSFNRQKHYTYQMLFQSSFQPAIPGPTVREQLEKGMGLLPLFIQPFRRLRLPPSESFSSQTVLITGANSGLGLETARHVVNLGASNVILGVGTLAN